VPVFEASSAPVKVLLLEDSDIDAELVTSNLVRSSRTFQIQWVNDRAGFVAALEKRDFDIILADYSLPDFDGLTALDLAIKAMPGTPFIFVSGITGEEFATSAITRGATDYVVKRNLSRLPSAIERALAESNERAERRRAEDALRQLNATLAEQIEARTRERDRIWRLSRDLFTVTDAAGKLISVNPAWWRILGHDETQLLSASFPDLMHPQEAPAARDMLKTLTRGEPVEHFEGRMRRRDGEYRWISWTAVPQENEFYLVGRDITDARQAAADLAQANASLKAEISERERVEATLQQMQRLEALGQLTSGVAHDFNNLLSVILGNVGFLERTSIQTLTDPKNKQRLNHIRLAAERGARLTSQLLAFSRRQWLEPRAVDLNETVSGMHDLLQSSLGGSVQLNARLDESLWPALVDRTQIEMVILNLVINARDAMDSGGSVTLTTNNVVLKENGKSHEPLSGDYVVLKVTDTGSGMTPEVLAKAFEPFFTTKGAGLGSGLGLAQVYGFAKQSGGAARIETRLGEGTTVSVFLPRAQVRQPPAEQEVAPAKSRGAERSQARILLVDDDSAVRAVTATILTESGYRVAEAGCGSVALDLLREERFDLLLVDYAMPEMNGAETAAAARQLQPELPVLYVTGYADLKSLRNVKESHIIHKPYREDELRQKLEAALP
jgi:PAS domain S-box-containing protein